MQGHTALAGGEIMLDGFSRSKRSTALLRSSVVGGLNPGGSIEPVFNASTISDNSRSVCKYSSTKEELSWIRNCRRSFWKRSVAPALPGLFLTGQTSATQWMHSWRQRQ